MAKTGAQAPKADRTRGYVSQSDIPSLPLDKALRIPAAIGDNYGYRPATPLQVAKALDLQPATGNFRMLTGAAIAYGLTMGGYNAELISITPLGMRILRPTQEGDDLAARREAVLRPRIIREFLQKYDSAPMPKDHIGTNVLIEMGVPSERATDVLQLILESAEAVGFLQVIKDRKYVELTTSRPTDEVIQEVSNESRFLELASPTHSLPAKPATVITGAHADRARRVFITHGKNRELIEPIKKFLSFAELEAVVSVQTQTVSQPVTGKVMEEMRSCGAAVIHVEDERHMVDSEGNPHVVLNDNVLIEVGVALALYGQRFILVVKEGVKLPTNLHGLLELRYKGDTLDMTETVKLLEAINDMKKRPLP